MSWGEPQVLLGTVSQTPEQKEAIGQKATSVQEKGCLEECLILPRLQKPGAGARKLSHGANTKVEVSSSYP